jgi:hypothetical protein
VKPENASVFSQNASERCLKSRGVIIKITVMSRSTLAFRHRASIGRQHPIALGGYQIAKRFVFADKFLHPEDWFPIGAENWDSKALLKRVRYQIEKRFVVDAGTVVILLGLIGQSEDAEIEDGTGLQSIGVILLK